MSTFSQFTGGNRIKSIQRGTITLNNATSATATIASVNTTKTELRMLGFSTIQTSSTFNPSDLYPRISLTSSTQITATRVSGGPYATTISWELTEFA